MASTERRLEALSEAVGAQGLRLDEWAAAQALQLERILGELQNVCSAVERKLDGGPARAEARPPAREARPMVSEEPAGLAPQLGNWESTGTIQSDDSDAKRIGIASMPSQLAAEVSDKSHDISALAQAKGWVASKSRQVKSSTVERTPWLWEEYPPVARLLQRSVFEYGVAFLILGNAVIIGEETNRHLRSFGAVTAADGLLTYLQDVCTVAFGVELALRIAAYRMLLFSRHDANWNVFDVVCVSIGMIELLSSSLGSQGSLVRTARIPRVLRVLRVFRLSRFFREIRLMMYMIMCSFRSLFWMLLLLMLLVYIVGVCLARFVVSHMQDVGATDLESVGIEGLESFTTVPTCMMTLLKAAFGGEDWGPYLATLQYVGIEAATLFLVYMTVMLLAILNVITGVFVDNTMQSVREDHDLAITEELIEEESSVSNLKHLFRTVQAEIHAASPSNEDVRDADLVISEEDFYKIIMHEEVRAYFAVLGLDATHAEGLYKLLDTDGNGQVGLEEFVVGCLRLKGEAKAVDVATIMYENKRIMKRLTRMNHHHSNELRRFYEALHADIGMLGQRARPQNGQARPVPEGASDHARFVDL